MENPDIVGLILVTLGLACLQGIATQRVWHGDLYSRDEKVAQTRLIWLVPLVGAVIVLLMLRETRREGDS